MSKHYVFWPFSSSRHVSFGGDEQGAGRALREFRQPSGATAFVRYGSKKHRGKLAGCNHASKSLYVTGHGAPGSHFIYNTPDGSDDGLYALQVVARLMEYGLQKTSACKIKLFTCYSGKNGNDGSVSFAAAVKFFLRQLHYDNVEVFGYTASVAPYLGHQHTWYRGPGPGGGNGLWAKASNVRVQV